MSEVKLWRYDLPSVSEKELKESELPFLKGQLCQGWATIIVGSDGFFAAVSDYGNYAFRWGSPGVDDFRKFLLLAEQSPDYFISKLSPHPYPYDGQKTLAAVKAYLLQERRNGNLDKETAREEWGLLEENEDLNNEMVFWDWCRATSIEEAHDFGEYPAPHDVTCFVTITMRRLCVLLRQELGLSPKGERREPTNPDRVDRAC